MISMFQEVGMDDAFFESRGLFRGDNLVPPLHPRCECAVVYQEVEKKDDKGISGDEVEETEEYASISGGKYYTPAEGSPENDYKAANEYRKISRVDDTKQISKNTGFSLDEIKQIKRHIFFEKHNTYEGYKLLHPDYAIAVAWLRLRNNNFLSRDILLLKHELLESRYEKEYNLTIGEAHERANKLYNWQVVLESEGGEPDGLL